MIRNIPIYNNVKFPRSILQSSRQNWSRSTRMANPASIASNFVYYHSRQSRIGDNKRGGGRVGRESKDVAAHAHEGAHVRRIRVVGSEIAKEDEKDREAVGIGGEGEWGREGAEKSIEYLEL